MVDLAYFPTVLTNMAFSTNKKLHFSRLEKATLAATMIAGLDVLLFPMISGGESFHQYIGITPEQSINTLIESVEYSGALIGQTYHFVKNFRA